MITNFKPQWALGAALLTTWSLQSPFSLLIACKTVSHFLLPPETSHFLSFPTCCLFHWGYRKIKRDHQATIPSHLWASALHNKVKVKFKMWCVCQICTVSEISTKLSKGSVPYQLTDGDIFPLVGLRHCSWNQSACSTKNYDTYFGSTHIRYKLKQT